MEFEPADFSDLPEFGVGHATNLDAMTGCTAFVARTCSDGVTCGVDVRGGGPATRETDLLRPENMVQKANAVVIGGGSAFGLEASCGVMEALAAEGFGFEVGPARVPIVPAACLFDLLIGKAEWPDKQMGKEACKNALDFDDADVAQGSVGAGTGATINKMGNLADVRKSGFGWSGAKAGELVVISCAAVNAAGNLVGQPLSLDLSAAMPSSSATNGEENSPVKNTTLGVVLTNANLTKAQATKVSQQAHDGFARAIKPIHTLNDGDAIFTMASGRVDSLTDVVGFMATETMEAAIYSALEHSR